MRDRGVIVLTASVVLVLVCWFWVRGERFIAANGPTFDEGVHLAAGYSYWTTGDFSLNAEDPPLLKLLWALPLVLGHAPPYPSELAASTANHWAVAERWMYGSGVSPTSLLNPARRINLALGVGVIVLVGWWAYRLLGSRWAGLATAAFAASDPNLLALSCILSTDVGLTFFGLLACHLMWEYVRAPSRGLLLATGISLGLMLAAKFSSLGICVGLGAAGLVHLSRGGRLDLPVESPRRGLKPALELAVRLGVIAVVTVAATYAFLQFAQWGKGLKFQLTRAEHGDAVMYLNGELSRQGWYHYFLVVLFDKLPLALLVAAVVGVFAAAANRDSALRDSWLLIPPLVFFGLASFSRVDMGIRVVLPVLPYVYLLAGSLVGLGRRGRALLPMLAACLTWCGWAAWSSNPHEISYFNELAATHAPRMPPLVDSNLDWGQGLPALKAWMNANDVNVVYLAFFGTDRPESHGIRYQQLPGYGMLGASNGEKIPVSARKHVIAVSMNHLAGLFLNDPDFYAWLRDRTPTAKLDGSIRVFDVTDAAEAIAWLDRCGPRGLNDQK